jgi:SAM-dependent methyltransferase
MPGFDDPSFYGDSWASVYDQHHQWHDPGPAVEFLAGLADGGRVLELAIGTGRVGLPLAARGVRLEGVDASAAMVERLRAKPGGASIPVTIGDMAQVPVSGPFRLVYLTGLAPQTTLAVGPENGGCARSAAMRWWNSSSSISPRANRSARICSGDAAYPEGDPGWP